MIVLMTILLSALSALFYRIGGMSKEEAKQKLPWVPQWMVASWTRDALCTILTLVWLLMFWQKAAWWAYLISAGLQYGALTTYWDWVPFNKGKDNFYMHGFFIALALFPIIILTGGWVGLGIRCAALALFMGIWCAIFSNVDVEECGRGASIIASLPLLFIG